MEPATISDESKIYSNLTSTQTDKPSWFNDPLYSTSTKVARLKNDAGSAKVGPSIILKVMAGDTYNIRVTSGWSSPNSPYNYNTGVLTDLLNQLINGLPSVSGGKATASDLQNLGTDLNSSLSSYINQLPYSTSTPKAYLNWVLLDEQFKIAKNQYGSIIASGYSGFDAVDANGVMKAHVLSNLPVAKSGYLVIYTSNEASNIDVYFDNLQVTHTRGPILEETHYYPFGLTMVGISGKAAGTLQNKIKYNGKEEQRQEFTDGSGLEWLDYGARKYDNQIGRWMSVDSKAADAPSWSPYRALFCNPIRYADPDGQWEWDATGNLIAQKGDNSYSMAKFLGTSQSNAMHILNKGGVTANSKGVLNLKEGQSFAKDNLWVGTKSASGPVVNNTKEATAHYYTGNGAAADVGDQSTRELLSSDKFQAKHKKITSEQVGSNGDFSVNMIGSTFHIGNTNVDYSVSGNGKSSSVTYTLFARDGFWDPDFVDEKADKFLRDKIGVSPFGTSLIPDQKGPNLERGGTPYDYKTRARTFFFKPVEEKK
jgi:RHS repeat-associated protein